MSNMDEIKLEIALVLGVINTLLLLLVFGVILK
jgi:hypothetical protein